MLEAVRTPGINPPATNAFELHTAVLPQSAERLRRWLNTAYAAHGGAESMTLDDWRDLELEFESGLQNENK